MPVRPTGGAALAVRLPVRGPVLVARPVSVRMAPSFGVPGVEVAVAVALAMTVVEVVVVVVMVPIVHVRPHSVCGSGRAGAHPAIMCV